MKINSKELVQSYIMTTAKYDYSVYEKRILYRIIENLQFVIEGKKLNQKYSAQKDLFGNYTLTMPVSAFLINENDKNHNKIKKAFSDLNSKRFEYEDDEVWQLINIVSEVELKKYSDIVKFRLHSRLADAFLDFSKGFRKYELKTAMSFESTYAMRFYELFSNKKEPITYSIENLKQMFSIKDKYKKNSDFMRYVVEPAKKELDKKSPYSFEYKKLKSGRNLTHILFTPYYIKENADKELIKEKSFIAQYPISDDLFKYLDNTLQMSSAEVESNRKTISEAEQHWTRKGIGFNQHFYNLGTQKKLLNAKNPKGYFITICENFIKE